MEAFQALLGDDFCFLLSPHIVTKTPRKRPIMTSDHADKMEITVVFQCPLQEMDGDFMTRGSMLGLPIMVAKALTAAVAIIAWRRNQKVVIVKYSDTYSYKNLGNKPSSIGELSKFLSVPDMGGAIMRTGCFRASSRKSNRHCLNMTLPMCCVCPILDGA